MATSGVDAVTLDPWHEPGIPSEQRYRSWKQRIKAPYDKHEVDAYTRTRVNLMNGIKVGAWNFSHHFARSTDDFELRSLLARTRMVDQQQTIINSPGRCHRSSGIAPPPLVSSGRGRTAASVGEAAECGFQLAGDGAALTQDPGQANQS